MKLQSKIKAIFPEELLDLIASITDTRRIDSLPQKMKILRDLLYTHGIKFDILGGATNRIAMFIDGYAVKFAMDGQGYRDNLIEYSICQELQPYVTKAYETNGYILVAECVRLMTESEFIARKQDILNILMTFADEYLLGDVGFLQKNRTNWGVRDNGELVILDYAYCHRATENLFTCPVCGDGILAYTSDFDKLICTNRTVCHAVFTYNQRKQEQGDQVDFDMIEERRSDSVVVRPGETFVHVEDGDINHGKFMYKDGKKVVFVKDSTTYKKMMEANKMISINYDRSDALDALVKLSSTDDENSVARSTAIQNLEDIEVSDDDTEYVLSDEYKPQDVVEESTPRTTFVYENDEEDVEAYDLSTLIDMTRHNSSVTNIPEDEKVHREDVFEDDEEYGLDYLVNLSRKSNDNVEEPEVEPVEEVKEPVDEVVEATPTEENSENQETEAKVGIVLDGEAIC